MDIKTFHRLVIRSQRGVSQGRLGFLKKVPLMEGLDAPTLQKISDALQKVAFSAGARIITEGEQGDDFFIIESGEVKCTHAKPGGGEQHLLTLKRGDYFGEMALMLDEPRHANVVATADVQCFRISRHDFVRLFGRRPAYGLARSRADTRLVPGPCRRCCSSRCASASSSRCPC